MDETTENETENITPLDDLHCVKALGANRVGGYAVIWGNPATKDLDGEYFTPETKELTKTFDALGKLPLFYNHATDNALKSEVMGIVDILTSDDVGIWYEAQLSNGKRYLEAIRKLISQKALGTSSGTYPGAREASKGGFIPRWPIAEVSLTPTPADSRQVYERPVAELKSIYKSIGLEFPEPTEGKGGEEPRSKAVTAKLKLLDLITIETGVY